MNFLKDKRRAGVIGLLAALLGAAALMVSAGTAGAAIGRCDDEPVPNDVWVNAGNQVIVGVDQSVTSGEVTLWTCEHVSPAPATWRDVKVTVGQQDPSKPGGTVDVAMCDVAACGTVLAPTGAEVDPATTTNAPLGGASGSGGSAGVGSGTCTWVNGSRSCPFGGITVAIVTVNEADLVPAVETTSTSPPPPCTGINNTCPGARVRTKDDPAPTVDVNVLGITGATWNHSLAPQCVQVNSWCP